MGDTSELSFKEQSKDVTTSIGGELKEKRAILKLDLLLMPVMTMFYLLSFLVSLFVPPVVVLLLTSRSISLIYRTVRILVLLIT